MLQFASFRTGVEQGGNPSVVGGKATPGGLGGGMENAKGIGLGQVLDHFFIFCNGEVRVATVGGINHDFEEFFANLFVDCFDHLGRLGRIGEILELHSSQKFEVPCLHGAFI